MARGQKKDGYKVFYTKLQGLKKGSKECYFEFKTKVESGYEVADKSNSVDGVVERLEHKTFEYEGKKKDLIELVLRDDNEHERYVINFGVNNISRQFLSCLSGASNVTRLRLNVFMGDKGFPIFLTYANGDSKHLNWNHDFSELNKELVPEVKVNGDTVKDYSKINELFLSEVLEEAVSKITPAEKPMPVSSMETSAGSAEETTYEDESEEEEDDLPF